MRLTLLIAALLLALGLSAATASAPQAVTRLEPTAIPQLPKVRLAPVDFLRDGGGHVFITDTRTLGGTASGTSNEPYIKQGYQLLYRPLATGEVVQEGYLVIFNASGCLNLSATTDVVHAVLGVSGSDVLTQGLNNTSPDFCGLKVTDLKGVVTVIAGPRTGG